MFLPAAARAVDRVDAMIWNSQLSFPDETTAFDTCTSSTRRRTHRRWNFVGTNNCSRLQPIKWLEAPVRALVSSD